MGHLPTVLHVRATNRPMEPDRSGSWRSGGFPCVAQRGFPARSPMAHYKITRTKADIEEIRHKGNHLDSRKAAWFAIGKGREIIEEIQRSARRNRMWTKLQDALQYINPEARRILQMRREAI